MKFYKSKEEVADSIVAAIESRTIGNTYYNEPFVGGGNIISKVSFERRIGADIDPNVIRALRLVRDYPGQVPDFVDEKYYNECQQKAFIKFLHSTECYTLFASSINGVYCGGYELNPDLKSEAIEQSKLIKDVDLLIQHYENTHFEPESVIYCDPPHFNFDWLMFWLWAGDLAAAGHSVFVSVPSAPDSWECIMDCEGEKLFFKGRKSC